MEKLSVKTNKGAAPTPSKRLQLEILELLSITTIIEMTSDEFIRFYNFSNMYIEWYQSERSIDWQLRLAEAQKNDHQQRRNKSANQG